MLPSDGLWCTVEFTKRGSPPGGGPLSNAHLTCTKSVLLGVRSSGARSSDSVGGACCLPLWGYLRLGEWGAHRPSPLSGGGSMGVGGHPIPLQKHLRGEGGGSPHRTRCPRATGKSEPWRPSNPVPSGARGGAGARRNLKRPFTGPCTVPPFMLSVV